LKRFGVASVVLGMVAQGCVFTLPFDSLSGGVPRPSSEYHLDEESGTEAKDTAGSRPGVISADGPLPVWTSQGKRGRGLFFDVEGRIRIPALSGAGFPARATLVLWVNLRELLPAGEPTPIFLAGEGDDVYPLSVFIDSSGIHFEQATPSDVTRTLFSAGAPIGRWSLVAFGWDRDANKTSLFVRTEGEAPLPLQTGEFPPDYNAQGPSFEFSCEKGTLDEVRFYDRLLSAAELETIE
jgi:hypothetical protein